MTICECLYELSFPKARTVTVDRVAMGLGYTAVSTSDGGTGLSYTYFEKKTSCTARADDVEFEGESATLLLERITDKDPLAKSMAMALVNALNYEKVLRLPEDPRNDRLIELLEVGKGRHVSMVGFFGPTIRLLEEKGAIVEIIDENRGLGEKETFYDHLSSWTEALILTSTALLNDTAEEILVRVGKNVKTVILGPSTPMIGEAFAGFSVHMLAGIAPMEGRDVFKTVCHGLGTPALMKLCHKKYLPI